MDSPTPILSYTNRPTLRPSRLRWESVAGGAVITVRPSAGEGGVSSWVIVILATLAVGVLGVVAVIGITFEWARGARRIPFGQVLVFWGVAAAMVAVLVRWVREAVLTTSFEIRAGWLEVHRHQFRVTRTRWRLSHLQGVRCRDAGVEIITGSGDAILIRMDLLPTERDTLERLLQEATGLLPPTATVAADVPDGDGDGGDDDEDVAPATVGGM